MPTSSSFPIDILDNRADKCAILIGMAELENMVNTDVPVIIDEAVKLCAKFSAERSTDFVNGILAQYSREK